MHNTIKWIWGGALPPLKQHLAQSAAKGGELSGVRYWDDRRGVHNQNGLSGIRSLRQRCVWCKRRFGRKTEICICPRTKRSKWSCMDERWSNDRELKCVWGFDQYRYIPRYAIFGKRNCILFCCYVSPREVVSLYG